MTQYAAQKTVTDQTIISLSQLDARYQQVALSALNLSNAERQEINTKLQGLAAGSLISGQQMQELLMDTNLDAATKKLILSKTGLTDAIGINTIAAKANVIEKLKILAAEEKWNAEMVEGIIGKMADTAATNTMTGANMGLAASFKTLMASIPVWGWIALAISAVISVLQTVIPMIKSSSEQLEETAQALADIRSEREGLNDELKTTQERIAELEAKGTLSFTDEAELNRLRQENAELERKLILLDDEEKKEEEKYRKKFNKLIGGDRKTSEEGNYFSLYEVGEETGVVGTGATHAGKTISDIEYLKELGRAYHDAEMAADGYFTDARNGYRYSTEDIQKRIDNMSDDITDYQKYLSDLYENGFNYSTADEETKKNVDFVNEMIDTYMVVIGKTDTLWSQVYNRDRFAEARKAIEELAVSGKLSAESLQNLYNQGGNVKEFIDYMLSLNTVDWKTMLGDDFDRVAKSGVDDGVVSITEALGWMNEKADNSAKIMGLFANELNKVEEAAEGTTSNIKTFSDVFKSIKEGTDVLADAYSDIEDGGEISLEHLMSLVDKYPDLVDYINLENGQHNITKDILKAKFELEKKNILLEIEGNKRIVASEIEKQRTKLNDIAIEKEKAKQRMATTMVEIGQFKTLSAALSAIEARPGYYIRGFDWDVSDINTAIADSEQRLKNLNAQEVLFKNMSWEDIISGSGGKTEKTEAEKYFDKQKYLFETNQITQEEYLKRIDEKYKEFYERQMLDLEDYAKYSQEVYDGFKDMYKEDLEAQKEAWEEKKDAVSEYYDNLREQIEDAHDEEDYEKEQSEKRKEIFDLDMQIAELMRDGSEKAKARIAELEEERLKAEEELLDFETDKAREDELSRLEKEQEAEEKKIQSQIDAIDEELQKIDGDIVDGLYNVRKTIVDYAAKKGITLDFAYASGTRSSVGGFGRINEKGIEMISAPDGNGNYIPMLPNSYVFSAKATEFLWKLATEHSLPQAMYNSIAKSIKTQSNTPSVNIAQPITITMGDVIIKGNADKQTVADIKKQQENTVRMVLQKIKELQK